VVPGLNQFVGAHPPVAPVFWSFRVMVGVGMLMLVTSWLGAWYLWRRGSLPVWLAGAFVGMTFSGWVATLAGWYVTEIGRQPWLITGVLRTAEAVGPIAAPMVASTLTMYLVTYAVLLVVYIGVLFGLARKAAKSSPATDPAPTPYRGAGLPRPAVALLD
jgi:cytochrome d ubiquinol oxidase subunit I